MNSEAKLLEALLSTDAFIQVNKKLIKTFGLHEAILIAELYSERRYWREHQGTIFKENESGELREYWYSTRENLEENTGLTPYYQRDALNNLETAGIVESKMMNVPAKKHYAIVDSQLLKALTASDETVLQQDDKGFNDINNKNNNKNNNKSTVAGASSKNRSFRNHQDKLTDDLQSGKDIDEQKKVKKKTSEYDKCLAEIDRRYSDPKIYAAVLNHLEWSYNSKEPNRIKTLKTFIKRLDELDRLTGDKVKIIQQSIDKQWHCFYEYKETSKSIKRGGELLSDKIVGTDLEDARRRLKEAEDEEDY